MTSLVAKREKTLFVTGASGFIGRNIVIQALGHGWHVNAFVRKNNDTLFNNLKGSLNQKLTITDGYSLSEQSPLIDVLSKTSSDAVIHCAASTVFMGGQDASQYAFPDVGALNELLAAIQALKDSVSVIIFGSALIYGREELSHKETDNPAPQSLYGVNKTLCSTIARYYRESANLPVTELRLFNIYGTGDRPPRLIPACIEAALDNVPISLTAGTQQRDFVHIDDVVRAVLAAANKAMPADIYNVATGIGTAISEIAAQVVDLASSISPIKTNALPPRDNEYTVLTGDNSRLAHYGLAPMTTLSEGLLKTITETRKARS